VRKRLLTEAIPVEQLHRAKVSKVKASAQAAALKELMPHLTAAEADVVRRARNLKTAVPRSASVAEYRYSTAFEALIGHLYLTQDIARLDAILEAVDAFMDRSAGGSETSNGADSNAAPNPSKEEAPHGGSSH